MIKAVIFDLDDTLIGEKDRNAFPYAKEILTKLKNWYKLGLLS
jgi:predicted HAD superfamily phosphohydrolase YqeG